MNGVEIAVAAVVFLLVGIGLCLLAVFCYVMLREMQKLQQSATEVKAVVAQMKEVFGEGSPIARAAKSVSTLANIMPETMAGLKEFTQVFSGIYRSTFQPKEVERVSRPSPVEDDSQFIPYDEGQAAQFEETAKARKERMVLSDAELAGMRTDNYRESRPVPEEPTSAA